MLFRKQCEQIILDNKFTPRQLGQCGLNVPSRRSWSLQRTQRGGYSKAEPLQAFHNPTAGQQDVSRCKSTSISSTGSRNKQFVTVNCLCHPVGVCGKCRSALEQATSILRRALPFFYSEIACCCNSLPAWLPIWNQPTRHTTKED